MKRKKKKSEDWKLLLQANEINNECLCSEDGEEGSRTAERADAPSGVVLLK